MAELRKVLADLGFPPTTYEVESRSSIIDLIKENERCGIYVLHFENGELYAGQAIDVARRFGQHRKNFDDIVQVNFKCIELGKLNSEEKRIIQTLEKAGFHLRNKVHASVTYSPSPFDEIMSPEEQESWVNSVNPSNLIGERTIDAELRLKYRRCYERLLSMPLGNEIIAILKEYVRLSIPSPKTSEMYYWICSCLLSKADMTGGVYLYSRININWQEVFGIGILSNRLFLAWQLAKSPIEIRLGKYRMIRPDLYLNHPIYRYSNMYRPGGQDQIRFQMEGCSFEEALNAIHEPSIIKAMRTFNLRLMRKGTTPWYKNHCFDLADRLLE